MPPPHFSASAGIQHGLGKSAKTGKQRIGLFIRTSEDKKKRCTPEELAKQINLGADATPTDLSNWDEVKLVDLSRRLPDKHVANNARSTRFLYKAKQIQPVAPASFSSCSWTTLNDDEILEVSMDTQTNNFSRSVDSKIAMLVFANNDSPADGGCKTQCTEIENSYASSIASRAFDAGAKGLVMVSPSRTSFIRNSCIKAGFSSLTFKHPLLSIILLGDEHNDEDEEEEDDDERNENGALGGSSELHKHKQIWMGSKEVLYSPLSWIDLC